MLTRENDTGEAAWFSCGRHIFEEVRVQCDVYRSLHNCGRPVEKRGGGREFLPSGDSIVGIYVFSNIGLHVQICRRNILRPNRLFVATAFSGYNELKFKFEGSELHVLLNATPLRPSSTCRTSCFWDHIARPGCKGAELMISVLPLVEMFQKTLVTTL